MLAPAYFKAQCRKLVIQYHIYCLSANNVFAIDIYQVVVTGHDVQELPHRRFKIVGGAQVFV